MAFCSPSRSNGCLSKARSVTGGVPSSATAAASRAKIPAGVSASASPPEILGRDVPALQRRQNAAAKRAVGRDQRGGCSAVLHGFAQRDRDRERLLLGIGRFDHGQRGERGIGMRFECRVG